MAYVKNPSDVGQSWRESAANDSASRWHGFDNKNNGKDKIFTADTSGSRMLAGVYGEFKGSFPSGSSDVGFLPTLLPFTV